MKCTKTDDLKRSSNWYKFGMLTGALLLATVAGCSKYSSEDVVLTPTPTITAGPAPTLEPTPTPAPFRMPLTGLPATELMQTRPVLITVENSPPARPQSGLNHADIVYEVLAEGEITRFLAIYQSQSVETIGPVRSMRPYFVQIGDGYDAVLVHAGWSPDAMAMMQQKKSNHLDQVYGDDQFYWRSNERKAPHNLYTSTAKIQEGVVKRKFRQDWNVQSLNFASENTKMFLDQSGQSVEIPYLMGYTVSYEYDVTNRLYKRSMLGKPHLDKETSEQLTTKNLLIIEANHKVLDNEGRRDVDVLGPGKGIILQEGRAQNITWERHDGIIRAYLNGKEIPLLPGNTWVQIVPTGTKVKIE
ncbi:DUF3048 domain-containing protein [Paenibacillus albiflavus]|uniref:DUF3048 domain-containing protein n=1 Tax=Paenibacillus albiflavus TaxID=2545760 RepID=A0A4R4EEL1_9BACL|nr:DUF3048 domain-containing protein [Paenibacillus albiflavus]TCZ78456.1 DUF3048 domain-containing protein [Paenibacillus albiflavus]